ncbi:MAG: DUF2259 domain-containing protein [Bauldia sp.]|uniref:DUF2259 domain-containing protein n=1 Tax=Bauldia sp. TaxID=2575872 RepID=UPI001D8B04A0|nr:DUF2259 domain-containing protein [Bauldia sp.]MCB1496301.1 DUF2259 domain-containing protein [Bauldia sp.]
MRLAILGFLALLPISEGPVAAADNAMSLVLGFSPDGRTFSFEEYGVQDGSGFPYSSIYVIDTATDQWVGGTPIRVLSEDETTSLESVRGDALDKARPILTSRHVDEPGSVLASNPITEASADPHFVSFRTRDYSLPTSEKPYELRLDEVALPAPDCPDMDLGQPFQGFRLTLTDPDGKPHVLQDDQQLPKSRRCPLSYGISEVDIFFPPAGQPVLVVLVNVFSYGFEGYDRRFLAVTGPLPAS